MLLDGRNHGRGVVQVHLDHADTIGDRREIRMGAIRTGTLDAEDVITAGDEILREIGAVLSADARDECPLASHDDHPTSAQPSEPPPAADAPGILLE